MKKIVPSHVAENLTLVTADLSLQGLNLWINLVLVPVLDELLDMKRINALIRSCDLVPATGLPAKIRLGHAHESYVTSAHDACCTTDSNNGHQSPMMAECLKRKQRRHVSRKKILFRKISP